MNIEALAIFIESLKLFLVVRQRHSEGYRAMYDICGTLSDGKVLNCPFSSSSVKVGTASSALFSSPLLFDPPMCPIRHSNIVIFFNYFFNAYSLMNCHHQRFKVCAPQLQEMYVVQRNSLRLYGHKSSR